jgi:hypothetical protein
MGLKSEDAANKAALDTLQRTAIRAAIAGFLTCVALALVQFAIGRAAPTDASLQTSFEAACVVLWPSAVLLLGAQTAQGKVIFFLLSACLNAGYFVFAQLLLAAAFDKIRSHARALAPVAVRGQRLSRQQVTEEIGSPRPVA